jgi:hypothetical protein
MRQEIGKGIFMREAAGNSDAGAQGQGLWQCLREAQFLTGERILLWSRVFGVVWCALLGGEFAFHATNGVMNARGVLLGHDFINYWAGARLAASGGAAHAYDLLGFWNYQKALVGGASEPKLYSYPPVCLLLTLPLALLPFVPALVFWEALGLLGFVHLLSRNLDMRLALPAMLASPAVYGCLWDGQNGLYNAILLVGGLILLERRPAAAGVVFGLLSYKPHLWILLPVALAAGRHWRAFFAAAATVLGLLAATLALFGVDTWVGFFHQMAIERGELQGHVWPQMLTVFCALHGLGLPLPLAYAAQAVSAIAAGVIVLDVWRRPVPVEIKGAVLMFACLLATPYAFYYDLPMTLFGITWLAADARRTGFLPWEKFAWLLVVVLPVTLSIIAEVMGFQTLPAALWFALILARRRAVLPRVQVVSSAPDVQRAAA